MKTVEIQGVGPRHLEVANSALKGKSNKEIASLMDITERTVKQYMSDLFKVTKVTSRSQFIHKCFTNAYGEVELVCR